MTVSLPLDRQGEDGLGSGVSADADRATAAQMEMARRIAFAIYRNQPGAHEAGYDQYIADGNNDADEAVQAALAAIIETTELAAKLVENWNRHPSTGLPHETSANIAERIERGDHLKGQPHDAH